MPTTIDRFFADLVATRFFEVYAFARNPWAMQDNMRANVQILQAAQRNGTLKVPVDKAFQDLGKAFQQRLALYEETVANDTDLVDKATALGLDPADLAVLHALLKPVADGLAAATVSDAASVDALVADVLADVPATPLAF